jgi:hypothetical protein
MRKSIEQLEELVARLREALDDAEAALRRETFRQPAIGDFVRCPLTNFFGRVTKVIPRIHGRPWVEITPYLTESLLGKGTLDLYDSWELIDPPTDSDGARLAPSHSNVLPIGSIDWSNETRADQMPKVRYIALSSGGRHSSGPERRKLSHDPDDLENSADADQAMMRQWHPGR